MKTDSNQDTKTYTLLGADQVPYQSELPGTLGGWRGGKIYGRLNCVSALRAIARGHYVLAHIHGKDYPFPAVYRIDRITELQLLEEKFTFPYAKYFVEGELRKRIQFMKAGPLMTIRFRFWGESPEAAQDRFPNAKIVNRTKNDVTIEAEVFGDGVVMWLLSQAEFLEVLEPKSLRDKMKQTIEKMQQNYLA